VVSSVVVFAKETGKVDVIRTGVVVVKGAAVVMNGVVDTVEVDSKLVSVVERGVFVLVVVSSVVTEIGVVEKETGKVDVIRTGVVDCVEQS